MASIENYAHARTCTASVKCISMYKRIEGKIMVDTASVSLFVRTCMQYNRMEGRINDGHITFNKQEIL